MRSGVLATVLCLLVARATATQWQREFGGGGQERGYSVRPTPDEGYIAAGFTYSFGSGYEDIYLVRTDSLGSTLWIRNYGGVSSDVGRCVRSTPDGGFVIAGYTSSFGTSDWQFFLVRTDAAGDTLWTRTYGGVNGAGCFSACLTPDSGYLLAGIEWTGSSSGVRLVKTNAAGDTLWTRTHVLADGADGQCVMPVRGGGYVVAGDVFSGTNDILLVRIDESGETLWTRTYGGGGHEYGYGVRQTRDGGFVVVGSTDSYGAGGADAYLIRTDADGDTLWTRTYGGPGDDAGRSIDLTWDGGFVIAGWVTDVGTCLIRTDSSGDTVWTRGYGGVDVMQGFDLQQTADSGFIMTGEGRADLCLVKTDAAGNAAVLETPSAEMRTPNSATIVRGVLRLPPSLFTIHTSLFDMTGRAVMSLHSGANDVGHLAPGVYFVRAASCKPSAVSSHKVLITR